MKSVLSEDAVQVQALLDAGSDINETNNYGWTALMHAARNGDSELVKLLISKGAQVDLQDDSGWTALMRAARKGYVEIVETLILHGADYGRLTRITQMLLSAW